TPARAVRTWARKAATASGKIPAEPKKPRTAPAGPTTPRTAPAGQTTPRTAPAGQTTPRKAPAGPTTIAATRDPGRPNSEAARGAGQSLPAVRACGQAG